MSGEEAVSNAARFWDKHADGYAKRPVKDTASYDRTLDCVRQHLSPSHECLEFGCGTGTTALRLAPSVKRITATDVSPRMIEIARDKARAQGAENVDFETATLHDEKWRSGSFDVVMGFNILHLIDDVPGALGRIRGLLRPDGLFVSKTVCLADHSRLWRVLLSAMRRVRLAPPVHCLRVAELEEAVRRAGFQIIETGSYPASPPSRFIVARRSGDQFDQ